MKTLPILFAILALPCAANAQLTGTPITATNIWEQDILNALEKMQFDSPIQLQLSGTETVNNVVHSFGSVLYWSLGVDPRTGRQTRAYVELDDYNTATKTPTLLRRYVGDGQNLWMYDFTTNTYSATFYSYQGNGTNLPASYPGSDAPRLTAQLYTRTRGASTYLVRLLQEINPGSNLLVSTYSTWAPGYTPGEPPSYPPTQDPLVPSRYYSTGATEEFVLYPYPITPDPTRSVAFQIDNRGTTDSPDWRLTEIYFADKSQTRFTNWTISISDPFVIVSGSTNSIFVPYTAAQLAGWRQITTPQPFNG